MEGRAAAIVPLVNDVADLPEKRNEILKIVITVYGLVQNVKIAPDQSIRFLNK